MKKYLFIITSIVIVKLLTLIFFYNSNLVYLSLYAKNYISSNITSADQKESVINIFEYKYQDQLMPKNLVDISNEQIQDHWKLYKGYVDQVNKLNKDLSEMRQNGQGNTLEYADRRRRYGFEYNGMVLHEYYFANLKNIKNKEPKELLYEDIKTYFGSFKNWMDDFKQAGKTRGIGWVILYADPSSGQLVNVYVQDHEINNITGFQPLLVMDIWEHAYMVDHLSGERGDYIEAFVKNINWPIVEQRYSDFNEGLFFRRF